MKYEQSTGMILCETCGKGISGAAHIMYSLDSDYVDETVIIHDECKRAFYAGQRGLKIPCPKCKTKGKTAGFDLTEVFTNLGRGETATERLSNPSRPCDLCDSFGYLAKEPISVVTDWKKA